MKTINKFLAIGIIAIMMLAILLVPVNSFADETEPGTETKTITINTIESGKTINVIEMFKITERVDGEIYYDFANDTVKAFFENKTLFEAMDIMEKKSSTELQTYANEFYSYVNTKDSTLIKNATVDGTTATVANVEDGYYVIYDMAAGTNTPKSAVILRNLTNETIDLKTNAITLDKKASVNSATATKADNVSAQVGDTVYFEVTTQVPNVEGYNTNQLVFTFEDTLSDTLKYNNDLKITINGNKVNTITDSNDEENIIKLEMGEYLRNNTKTFKETERTYTAGNTIVITYSAKVKTGAAVEDVKTKNSAKLTLSNEISSNRATATKELTDIVNIYTYILDVKKVNSNSEGLGNTEFQVLDKDGVVITFIENAQGDYVKYDGIATGTQTTTLKTATEVKGNEENVIVAEGTLKIAGLAVGNYKLEEIKATDGYSVPKDHTFEFTITAAADYSTASFKFDDDAKGFVSTDTITAAGKTFTGIQVKNAKKGSLPETGGMGTVMFTVVGIAVMAIAFIAIVARNKRNQEN